MPSYAKGLVIGVWALFMVIFGLISFPNHYTFRTYALDLGYSLQLMEYHSRGYLIPRGLTMSNPFLDTEKWQVAPHASPSVLTALPFYWVGGAWGLLVHQWVLIGVMAWGFFAYAYHRTGLWQAGLLTMLHFLGMWGITSLFGFDWHEVVSGIAWFPWMLYAIEKRKLWLFILSWALFIGGKENFTLWGIWIALWLGLFMYRKAEERRWLALAGAVAALWFVLAYFLYKGGEKSVSRLSLYAYLGAKDPLSIFRGEAPMPDFSFTAVAKTIFLRPQLIWTLLFESPSADPHTIGIKSELHWTVLWSGGWSFIFQPIALILLLPVYLYKMLSADYQLWGTLLHYNMEFAAVLPIAVLWAAERWRGQLSFWIALGGGALGAHAINLSLLDGRYSKWYDPERHRWYSQKHYCSPYSYKKIHEGLRLIPREAPVSALSQLAPHIPPRTGYYHYPAIQDAQYIALLRGSTNPWPLSPQELAQHIQNLESSPEWEKVWDKDSLIIFRRKSSPEKAARQPD
ncbi:MAG: DUF2079 domain-containing protein [Bacteroidia bacterium]|nr:DUF2079 domain-containing protein [Bacteroidia bacterium]MDW8056907.1 DUF2079 domain-containing protein [Bacteroidia bacterium]